MRAQLNESFYSRAVIRKDIGAIENRGICSFSWFMETLICCERKDLVNFYFYPQYVQVAVEFIKSISQ